MFETNPRIQFRNHRERGPKVHGYTVNDVAALAGYALSSIKGDRLMGNLAHVVELVCRRWSRAAREAGDADLLAAEWTAAEVVSWAKRWPRVTAWVCPLCPNVTLSRGACKTHGGSAGQLSFGAQKHFVLGHGLDRIPLHRVIMGDPVGLDIHHVDFNKWNNRMDNLVALTREEHGRLHCSRVRPQRINSGT